MTQGSQMNKQKTKIIWGFLFSSHFLYIWMGEVIKPELSEPPAEVVFAGLLLLGLGALLLGILGIPNLMKAQNEGQLTQIFIMQWALVEMAAILGFVGRYMGAPDILQHAMAAFALLAMLYLFPSEKVKKEMLKKGAK